jgi:hypothetical protein
MMLALVLSLMCGAATADVDGADDYRWLSTAEEPTRLYLYRGGVQQGGYDLEAHYYRPFDGAAWGAPCEPPLPPPCFGVVRDKPPEEPRYLLNGVPVAAEEARDAVERGIVDDRNKLRVTVIGPDDVRNAVRHEIESHPAFGPLRDSMSIRDYPPDHWALAVGFVTTGQPTVYCQAPSGQVLHRQDDYAGGADAAVTALRRAKESYDARLDPDLRTWLRSILPFADLVRPLSLLAAAGLGLAIARTFSR